MNKSINQALTGICVLGDASLSIFPLDSLHSNMKSYLTAKKSLFQQSLLIYNSQIIDCNIFGNKQSLRRALIQFDGYYCIGESNKPITIKKFQQALLNIGAIDVINLDMGSWSEGWYKDSDDRQIRIGDNFVNTKYQTNWLVYTKK